LTNKEIPKTGKLANDTYQLSGKTGSLRYMAPEVAKEQPYNETVDVYSLAILAWQIFEMDTPYKGYSIAMHNNLVIEKGGRPKLNPKWGENLCTWLKKAWSEKISDRPSTRESTKVLRDEVNLLQVDVEDFAGIDASSRTACSVNGKK
jgi:serine/threonine protein kinase